MAALLLDEKLDFDVGLGLDVELLHLVELLCILEVNLQDLLEVLAVFLVENGRKSLKAHQVMDDGFDLRVLDEAQFLLLEIETPLENLVGQQFLFEHQEGEELRYRAEHPEVRYLRQELLLHRRDFQRIS